MSNFSFGHSPNPPRNPAFYGEGKYGDTPHQTPDHGTTRLNPTSGLALVTGLLVIGLGLAIPLPWGLLPIVLGGLALTQIRSADHTLHGVALAIGGIGLGVLQIAFWLVLR